MKRNLLTLSAACLLLVTSCSKKNSNETPETTKRCLLTETTFTIKGGESGKNTFIHDDKGRVLTGKYGDASMDQYTYTNEQITLKTVDGIITTYKLDSKGRIITETYSDSKSRIDYSYDTEGYLTAEVELNGTQTATTKYTYTNGNLTSIDYGADKTTISYNNDPAQENLHIDMDTDLPNFHSGVLKLYFGKPSKNLVSKITSNDGYSESYIYEKDTNGNITKISMLASDSKGFTVDNKYTCK